MAAHVIMIRVEPRLMFTFASDPSKYPE